jgi:uncharacterized protein
MVKKAINATIGLIVKQFKDAVLLSRKGVQDIILFGSYARDDFHLDSDIDIAVITEDCTDDDIAEYVQFRKIARSIDNRIEPHIFSPATFLPHIDPLARDIVKYGIKVE